MNKQVITETVSSIFHHWNVPAIKLHVLLNAFVFFSSYVLGFVMGSIEQFAAVTIVVIVDAIFGIAAAVKQDRFETRRGLKIVLYLFGYNILLAALLAVEHGFTGAFWLSETIMIPILVFVIISILKNMSIIGLITNGTLKKILAKIDSYKDVN